MKEFKCVQCEHVSKTFNEFRVHQWLYHNTTNGNHVYPKDLRKEGYAIIKKEDLAFLIDWAEFGMSRYHEKKEDWRLNWKEYHEEKAKKRLKKIKEESS